MNSLLVVWHWWLSLGLAIAAIGMVIAVIVGYLSQVQRHKYPRRKD